MPSKSHVRILPSFLSPWPLFSAYFLGRKFKYFWGNRSLTPEKKTEGPSAEMRNFLREMQLEMLLSFTPKPRKGGF